MKHLFIAIGQIITWQNFSKVVSVYKMRPSAAGEITSEKTLCYLHYVYNC